MAVTVTVTLALVLVGPGLGGCPSTRTRVRTVTSLAKWSSPHLHPPLYLQSPQRLRVLFLLHTLLPVVAVFLSIIAHFTLQLGTTRNIHTRTHPHTRTRTHQ